MFWQKSQRTKPSTLSETLIRAKELIADKKHWTTKTYHRGILWQNQWCAIGAIQEIDGQFQVQAEQLLHDKAYSNYRGSAIGVNDKFGHEHIMHCYDEAIETAQQREAQLEESVEIT